MKEPMSNLVYANFLVCYHNLNLFYSLNKCLDSLRLQLGMDTFDDNNITLINSSDDWLRRRQGLALPVIPPTTPEARRFFFSEIAKYAATASNEGKNKINYIAFAQDWNRSADGKFRFYVTPEVLAAYAKTWERNSNVKASQDLIADGLDTISRTSQVFSAIDQPFPDFLTDLPSSDHPMGGVLENTMDPSTLPASISTNLAVSRPRPVIAAPCIPIPISRSQSLLSEMFNSNSTHDGPSQIESNNEHLISTLTVIPQALTRSTSANSNYSTQSQAPNGTQRPTKRRRVVPETERKRFSIRTCRRCHQSQCPGNSDILNCPIECTVPCIKCGRTTGCRGVDKGKKCTA
jgi:hypothetical protein